MTYEQAVISIHAPIVGCDMCLPVLVSGEDNFNPRTHRGVRRRYRIQYYRYSDISIHAPIVGCDTDSANRTVATLIFQSTHPSWGATKEKTQSTLYLKNFNPRTHRGVRLIQKLQACARCIISIHAPIVGCDIEKDDTVFALLYISIHAPIVGCDRKNRLRRYFF